MKNFLSLLMLLILFISCVTDNKKTVEGDLYFKLIDLRFFDAPDSILTKIESGVKLTKLDTLIEQDKKIYKLLQFMVDNELLRKPFIRLRQDDGKIIMVLLDTLDYTKIKDYNHLDLVRDNKRIRIKMEVSELKFDSLTAYESLRLISIDKIDGKTYWNK